MSLGGFGMVIWLYFHIKLCDPHSGVDAFIHSSNRPTPWAKSNLLPFFVNKILVEYSHQHLSDVYSYFHPTLAEFFCLLCNRLTKPRIFTIWPLSANACQPHLYLCKSWSCSRKNQKPLISCSNSLIQMEGMRRNVTDLSSQSWWVGKPGQIFNSSYTICLLLLAERLGEFCDLRWSAIPILK